MRLKNLVTLGKGSKSEDFRYWKYPRRLQGGDRTMASYNGGPMPQAHIDFLKGSQLWIERDEQVFVHGGFNPDISLASHSAQALV